MQTNQSNYQQTEQETTKLPHQVTKILVSTALFTGAQISVMQMFTKKALITFIHCVSTSIGVFAVMICVHVPTFIGEPGNPIV